MIIKLDDKFALVTDDYNFVLNGIRIKGEDSVNAGEEYLSPVGYYGTLKASLERYLRHSLRKDANGVDNVDKLLNKLNEIQKSIEGIRLWKLN